MKNVFQAHSPCEIFLNESRKSWRRFLFFVIVAVGINFNPFDSNLIWLSVKFALDRFFINLSLFFERKEVDSLLRSLRFLVFICIFVILISYIFHRRMHTRKNNISSQIGLKTFSMSYNNGI